MKRHRMGPSEQEMDSVKQVKIVQATTSRRLIRVLCSARIEVIGDIERMTRQEFERIKGCGPAAWRDMYTLMKRYRLTFADKPLADVEPLHKLDRPSWDEYFIDIAVAVSARSIDTSLKVGTVVVDTGRRIIATGYNGFPPNFPDHSLPRTRPEKYVYTVHSEANAIASSRSDLRLGTLYCTHSPCTECAKIIITAGIRRVVFRDIYATTEEARAGHELSMRLFKMGKVDTVWSGRQFE